MKFNPFQHVRNYSEMLVKIGIFTFIFGVLAVELLRVQVEAIGKFLTGFSLGVSILDMSITVPLATYFLSAVVAILFHVVKLHDRLSDLFGIRQRFDVYRILLPMAVASGASLSTARIERLKRSRKELMTKVFYKYASGWLEKPVIDMHYIIMALSQWAWYWILLEADTIALVTAVIMLCFGKPTIAALLLAGVLASIWLLRIILERCSVYAIQEVEQILEDEERKNEIKKTLNAV